jgi:hypothetical protein
MRMYIGRSRDADPVGSRPRRRAGPRRRSCCSACGAGSRTPAATATARGVRRPPPPSAGHGQRAGLQLLGRSTRSPTRWSASCSSDGVTLQPRADRLRGPDPEDHRDAGRALRHLRHRRDLRASSSRSSGLDREAATARRPRRPVRRGVRPGPAEPGDAARRCPTTGSSTGSRCRPSRSRHRLPPRRVRPPRPGPAPDLRRAARGRGPDPARRRDPLPAGAATARERRHRHRLRRRARLAGHRLRGPRTGRPNFTTPAGRRAFDRAALARAVHGPAGDHVRPARGAAADVQRLGRDRDHVQRPDVRPGPGAQQPVRRGVRVRPAAVGGRGRRALQRAVGRRLGDPGQHRGRPGPAVPRSSPPSVGRSRRARRCPAAFPARRGHRDAGQQPLRAGRSWSRSGRPRRPSRSRGPPGSPTTRGPSSPTSSSATRPCPTVWRRCSRSPPTSWPSTPPSSDTARPPGRPGGRPDRTAR